MDETTRKLLLALRDTLRLPQWGDNWTTLSQDAKDAYEKGVQTVADTVFSGCHNIACAFIYHCGDDDRLDFYREVAAKQKK